MQRLKRHFYPIAFISNMLTMNAVMIVFVVFGVNDLASDIVIAQTSISALLYAFSSNARVKILGSISIEYAKTLALLRLILLFAVIPISYILSVKIGGVDYILSLLIIARRACEWMADISLSEGEKEGDNKYALLFIVTQTAAFALPVLFYIFSNEYKYLGFIIWGVSPLLFFKGELFNHISFFRIHLLNDLYDNFFAHFFGTLATGLSLYVFRLLLVSQFGKSASADLFSAYAIGGILGAIFASAYSPTIAREQNISSTLYRIPRLCYFLGGGSFLTGVIIIILSNNLTGTLINKGSLFWLCVGVSFIASAVLIFVHLIRNQILIESNGINNLFGPDLIISILVITSIPLVKITFNENGAAFLLLIQSILMYASYKMYISKFEIYKNLMSIFLLVLAALPFFITFSQNPVNNNFFSGNLPLLPLSLAAAYLYLIIYSKYSNIKIPLMFIFSSFLLVFISTIIGQSTDLLGDKLLYAIQCILPEAAILCGFIINRRYKFSHLKIDYIFLYCGLTYCVLALMHMFYNQSPLLPNKILFLVIYQHLAYVPLVAISCYFLGIFSIPSASLKNNFLIILTIPIITTYSLFTYNPYAYILVFFSIVIFTFKSIKKNVYLLIIPAVFIISILVSIKYINFDYFLYSNYYLFDINKTWIYYINSISNSGIRIFYGHNILKPNSNFYSAYNYYLDQVYIFGLFSIFPIVCLIVFTIVRIKKLFNSLNSPMGSQVIGYIIVLFVLVLIENLFSQSLRQPFSAVFIFLIWGILLSRLTDQAPTHLKYLNDETYPENAAPYSQSVCGTNTGGPK